MRKKVLLLLIFAIISCIYPLYTTAEIRVLSHTESQDLGPAAIIPRVFKVDKYRDGTVVARIVRRNPNTSTATKTCFNEVLSLRIINLNGTVEEKDIKLDIPSFNFCISVLSSGIRAVYLNYRLIRKNQVLVTYFNAIDFNDQNTYEEWGVTVDFDGKVLDRTYFSPAFVDAKTQEIIPNSAIQPNVNSEKGFLRVYNVKNTDINVNENNVGLQQYVIEPEGNFTLLNNQIYHFDEFFSLSGIPISLVDESYALVFGITSPNNTVVNPLTPQGQLFLLPIGFNQTLSSPVLLYQANLPNSSFSSVNCDIAFAGIGNACILSIQQNFTTSQKKTYFVEINFLSSGSVISVKVINDLVSSISNPPNPNSLNPRWGISSLQFGGYLLTNIVKSPQGNQSIYGFLINENVTNYFSWEFPEPEPSNLDGIMVLLPNNTLMVSQVETSNTWQFQVIDLPRFDGGVDKGYFNIHVESTFPTIKDSIDAKSTSKISINFYNPVELSNAKLSIYQAVDNQQYILRQSIPGTECSIGNDSRTVSANVIGSTFSVSQGNYAITVENNFVKDGVFNEPLIGIRENVWTFSIGKIDEPFAPFSAGLLRLTPSGTQMYDSLPPEKHNDFFKMVLEDISRAVPIDLSRLTSNNQTQVDKDTLEKQYLISIGIQPTRDVNNRSVFSVFSVIGLLDTMVKNQGQSPIGTSRLAGLLDPSHGFVRAPDLWETYKTRLIGLFVVIILFIVLFVLAKKRNPRGRNLAILQLGLIVFDLIVDIFFVSTNAKDVPVLYIPSIVFVVLPITINTVLAFHIISQENERPEFYHWFIQNGNIASIFIVLAGADIEAFNVMQSELAGLPFFSAPFSDSAKSKIFWGAFLNIFTEDIPQVVVQIYYRQHTVTYDIIPLLTLVSSSVNLTINIIGRLYQATNRLRHHNSAHYNTPNDDPPNDDDNFGGVDVKKDSGGSSEVNPPVSEKESA